MEGSSSQPVLDGLPNAEHDRATLEDYGFQPLKRRKRTQTISTKEHVTAEPAEEELDLDSKNEPPRSECTRRGDVFDSKD